MAATHHRYRDLLWDNKEVKYTIENFPYPKLVENAVQKWSETGLKFSKDITPNDAYLTFRYESNPSSSSHTLIGHQRGQKIHEVVINSRNADILPRAILHEIGHALGLIHEHQRRERSNYIRLNLNNRDPSYFRQFNDDVFIKDSESEDCLSLGRENNDFQYYDFESIMHYKKFAYASKTAGPTITIVRSESFHYEDIMGTGENLSTYDKAGIQAMYNL